MFILTLIAFSLIACTGYSSGSAIGTNWDTADIWLRREIVVPAAVHPSRAQLLVYHDEDAEIYLDGVLAASETGYVTSYQPVEIPAAVSFSSLR
jgi:hypothetical protein